MKEAKAVWEANFKSNIEYSTQSITELKGYKLPEADLVICGFFCQDFSVAGKRKWILMQTFFLTWLS